MSDQIRVNGVIYDWGSIIIDIDGERYYGWTAISFGQKRKRTKVHGTGRHRAPRARTRGKYEADGAKLTGPVGTAQALRKALAAKSTTGTNYGSVEFTVLVQYVEEIVPGGEEPILIELLECVIDEEASSHEDNPDPLKEDVGIDPMYIKKNGLTLFDNDGTR